MDKLEEELPDILNRLEQYEHFDNLSISSVGSNIVMIVYLKREYFRNLPRRHVI